MSATAPTTAPKPVLTPRAANLKFLKASEAAGRQGLCMLVYGIPGSGKTTLAAGAQDSEFGRDVLLVDCDGGVKAIEDRDDVTVVRMERYADLMAVAAGLRSGEFPFRTVVIDTLSEAQARDVQEITRAAGREGMPQQQDWLQSSNHLTGLMRAYRDLAYGPQALNVVFTAHVKEISDDKGNIIGIRPSMTPAAMNIAIGAVDVLGYLTYVGGKRVLTFKGNSHTWAKVRQGRTVERLPDKLENPSMPEILKLLYGPRKGGAAK